MSAAPSLPRSRAGLRVLVLLLALLIPGSHVEATGMPVAAGEVAEADLVVVAPRPVVRSARRAAVPRPPLRTGATGPARCLPGHLPAAPPPAPPYTLRTLRSVVLRC
ncbi:hypothetical protein ACWDV7_36740 [Streptomyces sp. NPDC003362]